jgi:hypothetical protein
MSCRIQNHVAGESRSTSVGIATVDVSARIGRGVLCDGADLFALGVGYDELKLQTSHTVAYDLIK